MKFYLFFFLLVSSLLLRSQEDTLSYKMEEPKLDYMIDFQSGGVLGIENIIYTSPHYDYDLGYYVSFGLYKKNSRGFYFGAYGGFGETKPYHFFEGNLERYENQFYEFNIFYLGVAISDELTFYKSRINFQGSLLYFKSFDENIAFSAKIDYTYNFYKNFQLGIASELFLLVNYGVEQLHLGPVIKYRF